MGYYATMYDPPQWRPTFPTHQMAEQAFDDLWDQIERMRWYALELEGFAPEAFLAEIRDEWFYRASDYRDPDDEE